MPIYPETDKTMLEKILSGDEISWQEFYQRYASVVRALCRVSHLPQEHEDDVIQEVMSRFSRSSGNYVYAPERAKFRTYFNHIVRGAIADAFRKLAKQGRIGAELLQQESPSEVEWESSEAEAWRAAVLEEALQELASRVSSVNYLAFTMSVLEKHPIGETAAFLGVSSAQVYLARNRCAALLRKIIRRCNDADPGLQLELPDK